MKTTRISRTNALELIKNSKGRFMTVEFKKIKGAGNRVINCRYHNNSELGVVCITDMSLVRIKATNPYKSFKMDNLVGFSLNKTTYRVR